MRSKKLGALVIVEGETDSAAAYLGGAPVLGIPGAEFVKVIEAPHLDGIHSVTYVCEPDQGGAALAKALRKRLIDLGYEGKMREARLVGAKDTCELYAKDPSKFQEAFRAVMKTAHTIDLGDAADHPNETDANSSDASENFKKQLICDDEGRPKRLLANVMHVMSRHPDWQDVLVYDAFREVIMKKRCPPTREQDGVSAVGVWNDADSARTAAWFASNIGFEPTVGHVENALRTAAETRTVHEVRDYLVSCEWDGTPRLDKLLHNYFRTDHTEYTRAVGARWMISAVARAMRPGCQADCVLVLEGAQGIGKSTGMETLFGQGLFSDTPPTIGDKDGYQGLRGKWLIEFGELDAIKGREASKVKNFVSARTDSYRDSYGRTSRDHARQCVFCGTTNERQYLIDKTGNRRFWPVRCRAAIDVSALKKDRDQLWAEARARFENGEAWHVDTPRLRELCEHAQLNREVEDAWQAPILAWLTAPAEGNDKPAEAAAQTKKWNPKRTEGYGITTYDVLVGALEMRASDIDHASATRVGQVLNRLGWSSHQVRAGNMGERERRYLPGDASQGGKEQGCDGDELKNEEQEGPSQPSQPENKVGGSRGNADAAASRHRESNAPRVSSQTRFEAVPGVTDDGAAELEATNVSSFDFCDVGESDAAQ